MSTIKISELNTFPSALTTVDFFPIDKSSSLLTYRATLGQLQSLLSTGSFSGSLIGTASVANNALSSSYALTSSYSNSSRSSSYALTASYVSGSAASISGTGTAQYFTKWSNTSTLTDADIYYEAATANHVSTRNLVVSKNSGYMLVTGSGQTFLGSVSTYNSSVILSSATTASDAFVITCTSEGEYGNTAWGRGGVDFNAYTSSNNFTYGSRTYTNDALLGGILRILRIKSNGWYVWPLSSVQGISRDGTFNIGVDSGTENHDTRLKIQVFSGSSVNPTVDHLGKAIEVSYGSGSSYPVTFCVSSSGQVIATGYSGSNFNAVSFYGSASYALSSSNAVTASYAISTIPLENTSSATLSDFLTGSNEGGVGTYCYAIAHGFGVTPSWIRATLYCVTANAGYVTGDEVDLNAVEQDELDANVFTTWTNSTYAAISVAGNTGFSNNLYIPNKTGGTWTLMVPANWKYKIRVLK